MKTLVLLLLNLFLMGLTTTLAQQKKYGTLKIIVTDASSDEGQMTIGLYNSQEN